VITIRRADPADIAGIAEVVREIWDQEILPGVCQVQIDGDASALLVAVEERPPARVVGFVSAFVTIDPRDGRRWEVDLLAVRQDLQGQGLGTRLIVEAGQEGEATGTSSARALIRVENVASQRAFEKAGFTTDGQVHRLWLWMPEPGPIPQAPPRLPALLPVDTLTYRGLWIEGLTAASPGQQHAAIRAARAMVARDQRRNVGALIPAAEEQLLAPDLRGQAEIHGDYTWYVKPANPLKRTLQSAASDRAMPVSVNGAMA
jgi:ribosomal protein S18 acetylase RimI-like enzyme